MAKLKINLSWWFSYCIIWMVGNSLISITGSVYDSILWIECLLRCVWYQCVLTQRISSFRVALRTRSPSFCQTKIHWHSNHRDGSNKYFKVSCIIKMNCMCERLFVAIYTLHTRDAGILVYQWYFMKGKYGWKNIAEYGEKNRK